MLEPNHPRSIRHTQQTDVAIPNSHNIHSSITEKLQKYADWRNSLQERRNWKRPNLHHQYYPQRVLSVTVHDSS